MYLWIITTLIIFILFITIVILFWRNEIIAPPKETYPPYKPGIPNNFLPVLHEKNCLPIEIKNGFCNNLQTCEIDTNCDKCKPTQGESFHCVTVDKQKFTLPVNKSNCIVPPGKWCLPDYVNKCDPSTSITELVSDGIREYWTCKCKPEYQQLGLFTNANTGGSCNVQLACGNQNNPSNRLTSRTRVVSCIPSPTDPLCIQKYTSNYGNPYKEGNKYITEGTRRGAGPPYDLIITPIPGVGYKYQDWNELEDGPLLDEKLEPAWETSSLNPKCLKNPEDPSCNSTKWGGKCACDGFVPIKDGHCTDRLSCQTYVPSTLIFKDTKSEWFKCVPDTCWSKENKKGKLYQGEIGENTTSGETPPYLKKIGECDCGNIEKDENGYKSFIPLRIGGIPQCVRDPCNPGGFTYTDSMGNKKCICNYKTYVNGLTSDTCIDACGTLNNPCENGGKCSIDKNSNVICDCPPNFPGTYCTGKCARKGYQCNENKDCCSKKCSYNILAETTLCD